MTREDGNISSQSSNLYHRGRPAIKSGGQTHLLLVPGTAKDGVDRIFDQVQSLVDDGGIVAVGHEPRLARVIVYQNAAMDQFGAKQAEKLGVKLAVAAIVGGR